MSLKDDEQLERSSSFDRNKDGGLKPSPDQLETLIHKVHANTEEQLKQLFKMFDRDGKLGHALTAEELTEMINEADTDGDGRINSSEFSQAFDNSW